MIISCPKCESKRIIEVPVYSPTVKRVQCARCEHQFTVPRHPNKMNPKDNAERK